MASSNDETNPIFYAGKVRRHSKTSSGIMDAKIVREVASKTSDQAGDGTTSATLLAAEIVKEGVKGIAAGNPEDLKRAVDLAVWCPGLPLMQARTAAACADCTGGNKWRPAAPMSN